MKLPSPYTCDAKGCWKSKTPSNGWFLITDYTPDDFHTTKWDGAFADSEGVLHVCSAECAGKLFGTWLATVQGQTIQSANAEKELAHVERPKEREQQKVIITEDDLLQGLR